MSVCRGRSLANESGSSCCVRCLRMAAALGGMEDLASGLLCLFACSRLDRGSFWRHLLHTTTRTSRTPGIKRVLRIIVVLLVWRAARKAVCWFRQRRKKRREEGKRGRKKERRGTT